MLSSEDIAKMEGLLCRVSSRLVGSEQVRRCCDQYFDLTAWLVIGGSGGVVLLLWAVLRLKKEVGWR